MFMARRLNISTKVLPWWQHHRSGKLTIWSLIPHLPNPPLLIHTTKRAALLRNVGACDQRPSGIQHPPYDLVS